MDDERVIPVVAEEVDVSTRKVEAGVVRVHKTVHEHQEIWEQMLTVEHVEIERIAKNERVNGPQPVREEGDTTIISVVKEVPRVETDWVLTEEIRLTKRRHQRHASQPVTVRHEVAEIERTDAQGNAKPPDLRNQSIEAKKARGVLGDALPVFLDDEKRK